MLKEKWVKYMWKWIISAVVLVAAAVIVYVIYRLKKVKSFISLEETIGERCVVIETVDNYAGCGLVKVGGQIWSARGVDDDDIFEVGEKLSVVAIEGVKLICRKNN